LKFVLKRTVIVIKIDILFVTADLEVQSMAGAKSRRTGSDVLSLAGVVPVDSRKTTTDFGSVG